MHMHEAVAATMIAVLYVKEAKANFSSSSIFVGV